MLNLGRLCGLTPASSVVADDAMAVVAGLLMGLVSEEGACIFAGSLAFACALAIFCCSQMLCNVTGTSYSFICLSLDLLTFSFCLEV